MGGVHRLRCLSSCICLCVCLSVCLSVSVCVCVCVCVSVHVSAKRVTSTGCGADVCCVCMRVLAGSNY